MSARKRRLIITSLLTFIFLLIWTTTIGRSLFDINFRDEEGAWKTVEHEQYDFSLQYPAQWHASTYGEHGLKGDDIVKLWVYPSTMGNMHAFVLYQSAITPTVEDVVQWSQEWVNAYQNNARASPDYSYEQIFLEEDTLDGKKVARRRYRVGVLLYEETYIPRNDDMIVVQFQVGTEQFDNYEEEFEIILESFSPLE